MLENEKEVSLSEIQYMRERGLPSRLEGKEQPGFYAPDGRLRRWGPVQKSISRALPHRNDKVREDEQLADEENGYTSPEAETADKRVAERMSLGLEQSRTNLDGLQKVIRLS